MRKWLPFILIGGAAAYFANQMNLFKSGLAVRLGKISVNLPETRRALFSKLFLDVNVVIRNAANVQGRITGGKIDVMVNGKIVGSIGNIGATTIQAATETTVPLQVGINTVAIVPTIADLIKVLGKGLTQTVTITGNLITSLGTVTINETMKVKI